MEAKIPLLLEAAGAPRILGSGRGCFGGGLRVGPITGAESESSLPESSSFFLLFSFFSPSPKVEM